MLTLSRYVSPCSLSQFSVLACIRIGRNNQSATTKGGEIYITCLQHSHILYTHWCILGIACCYTNEHEGNSSRFAQSPITSSQVDRVAFTVWQSFMLLFLFILPAPTCYSLLLPSPPSPPSRLLCQFLITILIMASVALCIMCLLISQWYVSAHVCSVYLLGACAAWIHLGNNQGVTIHNLCNWNCLKPFTIEFHWIWWRCNIRLMWPLWGP